MARPKRRWRPSAGSILFMIALFEITSFGVIAINKNLDLEALMIAGSAVAMLFIQYGALVLFFPNCDRYVLIIANFLSAVGLVMQYRINPEIALKQLVWMGAGMGLMIVTTIMIRRLRFWPRMRIPFIILSGMMLAVSLVFGSEQGGAMGWISIGSFNLQPSEFVKILLIFVMAASLTGTQDVKRLALAAAYVAACLVLLLLQKDLGAALLYALTAVVMLYVGTGSKLMTGAALGAGAVGAVGAYQMFDHVKLRVALWKNPWAMYEDRGYQIVQGLIAIASGGLFGLGLTKGMPSSVPVAHADYIFAVICEEFGVIFGISIVAFYLVFIIRGAIIALDSRNSFDALVSMGCVTMITLQSFIIIGGVTKLIPLTGITMPFVSYGGSSMLSCYIILGILEGIAIKNGDADELEFAGGGGKQRVYADGDDYDGEYSDYDEYDDGGASGNYVGYSDDSYDEYEDDEYYFEDEDEEGEYYDYSNYRGNGGTNGNSRD